MTDLIGVVVHAWEDTGQVWSVSTSTVTYAGLHPDCPPTVIGPIRAVLSGHNAPVLVIECAGHCDRCLLGVPCCGLFTIELTHGARVKVAPLPAPEPPAVILGPALDLTPPASRVPGEDVRSLAQLKLTRASKRTS